ncbi:uncharacterized protein LOC26526390 [Drosophila erecta]|uniref:Uncharacterized protein n=1 Tax=Drosophila erecta TaxID=7220 RepID=A0A0Q5VLC9_DROER|nr:uncharacterized protein LOC26526390 [Drosophila erecta]XP_026836336.1 uncharacterized protein LOC26526390 [Drosophila erecta]KQS61988.1 uncharacterized protein Dere_GG26566 [Drosophila erecta]
MQALRTLIQFLATRHGQILTHIRRASGSSSFPELVFFDDVDDVEPDDEQGAIDPQYPILHSRHTDLFYLPHCVGLAYQGLISSGDQPYAAADYPADDQTLVKGNDNILGSVVAPSEMCVVACPKLLVTYMRRLFHHPYARFGSSMNFSMIGLRFTDTDADEALRSFVIFATHNSREIMNNGYWADFINPLTGRAHFRAAHSGRKQGMDAQLLGRGFNLSYANGCTIIEEERRDQLTGFIFTDTPCKVLESWCS